MNESSMYLLIDESGRALRGEGTVERAEVADDAALWRIESGSLACVAGDVTLDIASGSPAHGETVTLADGEAVRMQIGPARLPSEHLAELRRAGFTVLENVVTPEGVERIKAGAMAALERQSPDAGDTDGRVGIRHGLSWSADVARSITNPVALWLMQTYMGTDEIHHCHAPSVTTMRPAKELLGTYPESGWHSDYPYHPGVLPFENWSDANVMGVQFNICIDEFRADNAATQYQPGSHALCRFPPREFNEGGTRMGEGVHKDVRQMLAPAGSALVYDSRTWHRACDELNVSGEHRVAILNAVAPNWVIPMVDKRGGSRSYRRSETAAQLNDRERADIERLCNDPTYQAPVGAPRIRRHY